METSHAAIDSYTKPSAGVPVARKGVYCTDLDETEEEKKAEGNCKIRQFSRWLPSQTTASLGCPLLTWSLIAIGLVVIWSYRSWEEGIKRCLRRSDCVWSHFAYHDVNDQTARDCGGELRDLPANGSWTRSEAPERPEVSGWNPTTLPLVTKRAAALRLDQAYKFILHAPAPLSLT